MFSIAKTVLKTIAYAVFGAIIILHFSDVSVAQSDEIGIVIANNLNFRSKPSIESSSLSLLSKGTKVKILEQHNKWLKILHEGQVGYIRNLPKYVYVISEDRSKESAKTKDRNGKIEGSTHDEKSINREIEKGKAELLMFTEKETSIVNSLNDIDLTLDKARKNTSSLKKELADIEIELEKAINTSQDLQLTTKTRRKSR